jgi:intracellular sulfur oxidation DsrE/DsrF family protein
MSSSAPLQRPLCLLFLATLAVAQSPALDQWPRPLAPVIPAADGYVVIPGAAVQPDPALTYRAIFDASRKAPKPTELLPALNMAGSELNAFAVARVPQANVKFAVVFHGAALDGLLDDKHYRARFGVSNPNLPVLQQFKRAGVELLVCGQNLASEHIDPKSLSPAVTVASDALIVLMAFQNRGYALLVF